LTVFYPLFILGVQIMTVKITEFPQSPKTSEPFVLKGTATDVDDGDELLILVDDQFEVARPRVQNGKWEVTLIFNRGGDRLVEVIASDQDNKAKIVLSLETGALEIISRSIWGANPPKNSLVSLPNPKRITIHHTVKTMLPTTATQATEASRMLEIQQSHQNANGWSDIGYHYIIMPSGRIYEGRPNGKKGAHDQFNDGFGVAFDGSFELSGSKITDAQFNSAVALCTQLCKKIRITDPTTLVSTPIARDGKTTANLPRILGHQDRINTACPGMKKGTSVRLEEIRQEVKNRLS
jgi:hypothetical protein